VIFCLFEFIWANVRFYQPGSTETSPPANRMTTGRDSLQ
jgi:hypothetical protein